MTITPIEIQQRQFKTRIFGYDSSAVDSFLEDLANEIETLNRQNQELKEELARSRQTLQGVEDREATLKQTLVTAQKVTDELKANARREADILIANANLQAEKILQKAEKRRLQLIGDIQEIKRQKISFESRMRSLVESHLHLLEMGNTREIQHLRDEPLLEEFSPDEDENFSVKVEDDFNPEAY